MKLLTNIILLFTFSTFSLIHSMTDYQTIIQPCAAIWKEECIHKLSTQDLVTISDMLLLSYQVVQASCVMSLARLEIQSELFNIITLSIHDTFDARLQAQNNDFTRIKNAISVIEQAQEQIKFACNTLKNFGPLVIQLNPTPIQLFISNVKTVILEWAKTQEETLHELESLQQDFLTSSHHFSHLKDIFEEINSTNTPEQTQLVDGANTLHELYHKIEKMIAQLTSSRHKSVANFHRLLGLYFKYHYTMIYEHLQNIAWKEEAFQELQSYKILATVNHQLPDPETFFTGF